MIAVRWLALELVLGDGICVDRVLVVHVLVRVSEVAYCACCRWCVCCGVSAVALCLLVVHVLWCVCRGVVLVGGACVVV